MRDHNAGDFAIKRRHQTQANKDHRPPDLPPSAALLDHFKSLITSAVCVCVRLCVFEVPQATVSVFSRGMYT